MWIGWLRADLLLGDVHSLKQKRSVVRPVVAEVRRRLEVSVAEVDHLDTYRRTTIGVSATAADRARVEEVLDVAERLLASRPEVELVETQRRILRSDDV